MLKHVGKHNDRKVVILFREVPGEDHMALVTYGEVLPRLIHDEVMKCLESPVGQQAKEFSDALFRVTMSDGRNCLEVLHKEGMIKKVPTNQVVVTPTGKSNVRLDELNKILKEMEQGEDAVKRLAELDAAQGATGKQKARPGRDLGDTARTADKAVAGTVVETLSDADLAAQRLSQAEKMKKEAAMLIAEAERLVTEASQLAPLPKVKNAATKKKVKAD